MSDGLEGIIAAETALSHVDGEAGRLIMRGHDLDSIAGHLTFEETAALLWQDLVTPALSGAEIRAVLGEARQQIWQRLDTLLPLARNLTVMEGLRLVLASLGDDDTVVGIT